MNISMILASDINGTIGINNDLPWKSKLDMEYFKNATEGKIVIMGRKTFESIGSPLKNRINVVLTRDENYRAKGCIVKNSIEECFSDCLFEDQEVFIIGGAEVYKQFEKYAKIIYRTLFATEFKGDATYHIPDTFIRVYSTMEYENDIDVHFQVYKRK